MKILTTAKTLLDRIFKRKAVKPKRDISAFEGECAFCDTTSNGENMVTIEDCEMPCCALCEAKIVNGIRWTSILKMNYNDNKRRYCSKYLRIVIWFSES